MDQIEVFTVAEQERLYSHITALESLCWSQIDTRGPQRPCLSNLVSHLSIRTRWSQPMKTMIVAVTILLRF